MKTTKKLIVLVTILFMLTGCSTLIFEHDYSLDYPYLLSDDLIYVVDDVNDITYEEQESGEVFKYTNKLNPIELISVPHISYYKKSSTNEKEKNRKMPVNLRSYNLDKYIIFYSDDPENCLIVTEDNFNVLKQIIPNLQDHDPEEYFQKLLFFAHFDNISYDSFENIIDFSSGCVTENFIKSLGGYLWAEDKYLEAEEDYSPNSYNASSIREILDDLKQKIDEIWEAIRLPLIGIRGVYDLSDNSILTSFEFNYLDKKNLNIDAVSMKIDDDKLDIELGKVFRDSSDPYYLEYSIIEISDENILLLNKLAQSQSSNNVLRFYGDYGYETYSIDDKTQNILKEYIQIKDLMN